MNLDRGTIKELESLVKRVKYKPNSNISLRFEDNLLMLDVRLWVRNSEIPLDLLADNLEDLEEFERYTEYNDRIPSNFQGKIIEILNTEIVPLSVLESHKTFLLFIYKVILDMEKHELQEWLKIDDQPLIGTHGLKGVLD